MRQFMQLLMRPLAAAVLTVVWILSVPAANAQLELPSPGPSDQTPNIPDQKLDATAAALEQVDVADIEDGICSHVLISRSDGSRVRVIKASADWPISALRRLLGEG